MVACFAMMQGMPWFLASSLVCSPMQTPKMACLSKSPMVTFTSASTVKGFVGAMGDFDPQAILGVCIGEQTRLEAKNQGIPCIMAKQATMDALIDAMEAYVLK